MEPLEHRRLLAVFTVENLNDAGQGSLRAAIDMANALPGPDTIEFEAALDGGTITLSGTELAITESLTIDASPLQNNLVVDANRQSRVMNFTGGSGDLTIRQLTLNGGRAFSDGGAISFASSGALTVIDSTISGNSSNDNGGGIAAVGGQVTIDNTVLRGNTSARSGGGLYTENADVEVIGSNVTGNSSSFAGGGVYSYRPDEVRILDSSVSGNFSDGRGGAIFATSDLLLDNSVVDGNTSSFRGGGIYAVRDVTLIQSTVSGNESNNAGGGIWTTAGELTLMQSTVSGNGAGTAGGGIWKTDGGLTLTQSTVSGNASVNNGGGIYTLYGILDLSSSTVVGNSSGLMGGGVFVFAPYFQMPTTIRDSIIAGNSSGQSPDLRRNLQSPFYIDFSLIGDNAGAELAEAQTPDANGNLIGSSAGAGIVDARLAPLGDNGGPTQTHALLPGSPAIDAGNSSLTTDQRGLPVPTDLPEVPNTAGGNGSDMGAFERQVARCDIDGDRGCDLDDIDALIMEIVAGTDDPFLDLTGDGFVDLADRDLWLADAGLLNLPSGKAFILGDANLDGVVDGQDFVVWNAFKFTTTGKWSQGDWDADGATDGRDFILWNVSKSIVEDRSAIQRAHSHGLRLFDHDDDQFVEVNKLFLVD